MKKRILLVVTISLILVLSLTGVAYAKGGEGNPVEVVIEFLSGLMNTSQVITGGDYVQGINSTALFEYDEDQVAHVSLTLGASGAHFATNAEVFVRLYFIDDMGFGFGPVIPILDKSDLDIKTIEFNAQKWELVVTGGNCTTNVGYAYTITYPPLDE